MNVKSKKQIIKIICIILAVISILLLLRFWWRIYPGYLFCDNAETGIAIIEVTDEHASFSKSIFNLGHFFDGYKSHQDGTTLYIGIKTMFLIGSTFDSYAEFTIPTEGKIEKIVLSGGGKERVVYEEGDETSIKER